MKRLIAVLFAFVGIVGTVPGVRAGSGPGPGIVAVVDHSRRRLFFTEDKDARSRASATTTWAARSRSTSIATSASRAKSPAALGIYQDLQSGGFSSDLKTPNLLNYSGNLVISAPNRSSVVPYVTGGVGGLSLFETRRPRDQSDRDVSDGQRRRRPQVVRGPVGPAR